MLFLLLLLHQSQANQRLSHRIHVSFPWTLSPCLCRKTSTAAALKLFAELLVKSANNLYYYIYLSYPLNLSSFLCLLSLPHLQCLPPIFRLKCLGYEPLCTAFSAQIGARYSLVSSSRRMHRTRCFRCRHSPYLKTRRCGKTNTPEQTRRISGQSGLSRCWTKRTRTTGL